MRATIGLNAWICSQLQGGDGLGDDVAGTNPLATPKAGSDEGFPFPVLWRLSTVLGSAKKIQILGEG